MSYLINKSANILPDYKSLSKCLYLDFFLLKTVLYKLYIARVKRNFARQNSNNFLPDDLFFFIFLVTQNPFKNSFSKLVLFFGII